VRGLWVSMFDVFWVLFGVVVLGGGFWPQVSIVSVCAWLDAFVVIYLLLCTIIKHTTIVMLHN